MVKTVMKALCKKRLRFLLTAVLVIALATTAALSVAADEFSVAAIISANDARQDYATMDAAVNAVHPGDTLVILKDWTPKESITFPIGVTVYVPRGIFAGSEEADVIVTVLGTVKSTGALIGNWQLQGNVTISWDLDGNGTVDEIQIVQYGEVPSHADGYRAREGMYVYNFAGWDKTLEPATTDVTYTARFTRVVSDFSVGWDLDGNGTVDVSSTYAYGEVPTPPSDGVRPDDAAKTYKFIGWDNEIVPVSADVVYTAVFSATPRSYTISFDTDGDGDIDRTTAGVYGSPLMPNNGQKADTAAHAFAFTGWTPALQDVTADAVYYAQFAVTSVKDNTRYNGTLSVNVLNLKEEELSLLFLLESSGTVYAVNPVTIGAGINQTVQFSNLPDGTYSLKVEDEQTGGCLYVGIVSVTNGEGTASVMLTGTAPVLNAAFDEALSVIALDLPESWLNHEVTAKDTGLTFKDWESDTTPALNLSLKVLGNDAPFHETLEKAASNQKIAMFLQLTASKTVGDVVTELSRIPEIMTLLVKLPDDVFEQMKSETESVTVYRVSAGATDQLTATPNLYGEYFTLSDDGIMQLCLRSSATYAIAYDVPDLGFPLWWILMLFDAAGAMVLYIDRFRRPLDYPVRLSAALALTVIVVTVLSLRQGVMEIVFASLGWILLTLLICWSGSGNHRTDGANAFHFSLGAAKQAQNNDDCHNEVEK